MSEHSDYSVVVYLNQAVVFDLLAIIEDGMAQVSTIRTSESKKAGTEAGIGASNVFALLGVRLKGALENVEGREVTHERVHTPTSLFSKVRNHLRKAKLVHDLTGPSANLEAARPGHFVEVEVRLRRNPLIDALEAVNETIAGIKVLTSFGKQGQKSAADKTQEDNLRQIAEHCKRLSGALTGSGTADLVGEIVPGPGQVVVPIEDRFFGEHSADEVADGQFRVFGKVVRTVLKEGEGISLLRNTKFAHIPSAFDTLKPAFAATKQSGVTLPEIVTEMKAPAVQVRPIAIFL
jgi:hypothetical protein